MQVGVAFGKLYALLPILLVVSPCSPTVLPYLPPSSCRSAIASGKRIPCCPSCLLFHPARPLGCLVAKPTPPAPACLRSAIAFGKLHALLPSKPLHLPGKNLINLALVAANLAAGWAFATAPDVDSAVAALGELVCTNLVNNSVFS